jgi:FixJ family two-component response regulator
MIVGAVEQDREKSPFNQFPWNIERVADCLEFLQRVFRERPHVLVAEQHLPDGSWRDILGVAQTMYPAPSVIVTSRRADDSLWAEVLTRGGYDALSSPLHRQELRRVIEMAWVHSAALRRMADSPRGRPGAMAT